MKNRLLKFLTLVLSLCCAVIFIVACGDKHEHSFTKKVTTEDYIASEATCTEEGTYYYSCACGEKGTETFKYGGYDHTYLDTWTTDENYHYKKAACGIDSKKDYGEHSFDSNATCSVCEMKLTTTEGVLYDESPDGTYARVIGYNGTSLAVKISDTYNDLPVKSIYVEAFKDSAIKAVFIPSCVTDIDGKAFYNCHELKMVSFGENSQLSALGYYSFYNCYSLESIEIPSGVDEIPYFAFEYCTGLKTITFSENSRLEYIKRYAFSNCDSLESIEIPSTVKFIEEVVFLGCDKMTTITFDGTKEQWAAIEKNNRWNEGSLVTKVVCTDGEITI